jgi:hypothetical protein
MNEDPFHIETPKGVWHFQFFNLKILIVTNAAAKRAKDKMIQRYGTESQPTTSESK